jgi:hypothetical protein
MARPLKKGLDYFPLDVDIFEDDKIEPISGEFGIKGELAVIKLLCAVYKNGYFIVWNDLTKMKLLKRLPGYTSDLLDQIVHRLVKWDFFDKVLFDSDSVLTSLAIQERFLEATKRRGKNRIEVYVVSNLVIDNINNSSDIVNVNISTQSKVKESKENISPPKLDEVEEKKIVGPSEVLLNKFPSHHMLKAKSFGMPHDKIPEELEKFDDHHLDFEFVDEKHVLNSWGIWCSKYQEKLLKPKTGNSFKKTETKITKPTFNNGKTADKYD